jgi:PadR family transcriptional regulator, regulatory protein AphA
MARDELSGAAYVVLGMLGLGARTGYDIKGIVDKSTRFFWAASYGQIYPDLRRLEKEGLVRGTLSPTGGRKRKTYELTAEGRRVLFDWAAAPPRMPELRDENLLKLFFADLLPREQAIEQLRMRRRGHEEFLRVLRTIEEEARDDPTFVRLVLQYGIEYAEWNIEWCRKNERRLAAKEAA